MLGRRRPHDPEDDAASVGKKKNLKEGVQAADADPGEKDPSTMRRLCGAGLADDEDDLVPAAAVCSVSADLIIGTLDPAPRDAVKTGAMGVGMMGCASAGDIDVTCFGEEDPVIEKEALARDDAKQTQTTRQHQAADGEGRASAKEEGPQSSSPAAKPAKIGGNTADKVHPGGAATEREAGPDLSPPREPALGPPPLRPRQTQDATPASEDKVGATDTTSGAEEHEKSSQAAVAAAAAAAMLPLRSLSTNPVRKERIGESARSSGTAAPRSRRPTLRLSGASVGSGGSSGDFRSSQRVLSVPPNLGRDELSLNKLRFTNLGLYGREMEILRLRNAYDEVRLRKQKQKQRGREGKGAQGQGSGAARGVATKAKSARLVRCSSMVQVESLSPSSRSALSQTLSSGTTRGGPSPGLVLIAGRSGCGKSALATHVRSHVRRTGGLFASGKFDALRRTEPYTAFARAFSGLCDHILDMAKGKKNPSDFRRSSGREDSTRTFLRVQSSIRDAVGSEEAVLAEVVPNLSRIIGPGGDHCQEKEGFSLGGFEGTKNRFQFAMRRFLRAVCKETGPLVLFLDDLQWADAASLDLLRNLITDRENPNLLVLGSYRDNEVVHADHPFKRWLQGVEGCVPSCGVDPDASVDVTHIDLGNIDLDAVNELIADLLNSTLDLTRGLAEIVHRKTHGNGFAIVHFLKSLHEEGLLYYCLGTLSWKWDDEEVRVGTSVTDNVADLMTHKIENHLAADVQEVLRMASCLGSSFDSAVLATIAGDVSAPEGGPVFYGHSGRRRVLQCLDSCIDEGLLEADGSSCGTTVQYRFAHDQIAAAAFALIPENEREILQLRIGEALLKNLSDSDVERDLFIIVGLLNRGVALLQKGDERCVTYAALNLRAGRKAMDASAFETAAKYLSTGVDLLGPSCWQEHPTLTLDLFSTAAEAECVNAHQEEMKSYIDKILAQELPIKDKVRAYCTLMHSLYFLQDKALEALDVGLLVLEELGIRFPRNNLKRATIVDLVKTKLLFRRLPIEDILSLPTLEDETRLLQMQIMNKICDLAYFAKPAFLPWVVFKMVRISVKRGACKYSSGAFACYGLLLVSLMGDIQKAHEFSKVSVAMLKRFDARELEARVLFICNCFISHWVVPAHLTHKRLMHGYEVGMQTGDTGFAMLSVRTYCLLGQFIGKPLALIDQEMATYTQQMRDHKQEKVSALLLPAWQLVLNLMGCSEDPSVLSGQAMQLVDMLRRCDDNGDDVLRNIIESHQIWAAFYFGNYEFCGKLVQGTRGKTKRATVITWRRALFDGLTAFELARRTKSREWKTHAAKVAAKVRGWAEKGNVNCLHVQFLFEAERAALDGKHTEAREKYEKAISTVSRHGFLNDRALANERAGEYFLENGDKYFAAHHLGLAHQLYSNWGATAKAAHLYDKHKGLFDEDSGIPVGMDIKRRWSD